MVELLERLPIMAGMIDLSLDWQYMIEVITVAPARPDFQLVSGTEYMISAAAVGATGLLSPLAGLAPKLVGNDYKLCMAEKFTEARPAQDRPQSFHMAPCAMPASAGFKTGCGPWAVIAAQRGRRLLALTDTDSKMLLAELTAAGTMISEPRGWVYRRTGSLWSRSQESRLVKAASYGVGAATALALARDGFDVARTATRENNSTTTLAVDPRNRTKSSRRRARSPVAVEHREGRGQRYRGLRPRSTSWSIMPASICAARRSTPRATLSRPCCSPMSPSFSS